MAINLMNLADRKKIIDQINSDENKDRKKESLKRYEIYKNRHEIYILQKLNEEFTAKTVTEMRKVTSINLAPRILKEQASIYNNAPDRNFGEVSDKEKEALEAHYAASKVNVQLKLANLFYKLFDQCALYVVPKGGKLWVKPMAPHWYDVIPKEDNPEEAEVYIMNILDKQEYLNAPIQQSDNRFGTADNINNKRLVSDGQNQTIADADDYKSALNRYVVWSNEYHFIMNGQGHIVTEMDKVKNDIEVMPFIDVASEKDFEFFCRYGSTITDFAVDFGVQLSDHSNILRMQGYSQSIISAEKEPKSVTVGPTKTLFLQQDPNSKIQPKFEFATPSPDLSASLETLEVQLKLLLSTQGIDPKTISGSSEGTKFNSGLDRLLAMIDRFEASRSDIDLFVSVEEKLKDLIVIWNNSLQDASDLKIKLDDKLVNGIINEDCVVEVKFNPPEIVQTKQDKEESVIKLVNEGLMTKKEAIMELREVDETMAEKILTELNKEEDDSIPNLFSDKKGDDGES